MSSITITQDIASEKKTGGQAFPLVLFALCFAASVLGGTISAIMSVYLPVAVKELSGAGQEAGLSRIGAYINSMFLFGWTLGGFCWGMICDGIGRKKALLFAIACSGLFTVVTGLMTSWWGVTVCRFFSGFGVGGVLVVSFTLLSEILPQKNKAVFIGILSIAFPVGLFSAGLINNIVDSWREGFLVGMVPVFIAFAGMWYVQESPYWKEFARQRKMRNAKAHGLLQGGHRANLVRGSVIFGAMLIGLWAIFLWLPTWVQSLIGNGDGQKERGASMMLLGVGGLSGGFVSGWIANAITTRKAMIICFAMCMLMSFVLFRTNAVFHPIIYGEIAVLAFFFGVSQGVMSAYIPQLFPTAIRATATGFCFNLGRLLTATAVLFVGVLETALGGYSNAIFIFSLVFAIGLLTILLMKEKT